MCNNGNYCEDLDNAWQDADHYKQALWRIYKLAMQAGCAAIVQTVRNDYKEVLESVHQ